jgi:hypothetical protein
LLKTKLESGLDQANGAANETADPHAGSTPAHTIKEIRIVLGGFDLIEQKLHC